MIKVRIPFTKNPAAGLLREFDDNYYDKMRVYRSIHVKDIPSAGVFAVQLRSLPGLHIDHIFFEDLRLRDEENALPVEETGAISDDLLSAYIHASDIDLIKFVGEYNEKRIEIGIRKHEWEVWLRIWHLTDDELNTIENALGLC